MSRLSEFLRDGFPDALDSAKEFVTRGGEVIELGQKVVGAVSVPDDTAKAVGTENYIERPVDNVDVQGPKTGGERVETFGGLSLSSPLVIGGGLLLGLGILALALRR